MEPLPVKEPSLLPTTYPNLLVSANQGIAVGMASQLCGFNLAEVCGDGPGEDHRHGVGHEIGLHGVGDELLQHLGPEAHDVGII